MRNVKESRNLSSWVRRRKWFMVIPCVIILSFVSALFIELIAYTVFRLSPASSWTVVVKPGEWSKQNSMARSMAVYNDGSGQKLYVGTSNDLAGCEVRASDSNRWTIVGTNGIGNDRNKEAMSMVVFKSKLYVGTRNANGCEVRRYDGGKHWSLVIEPGFGSGKKNGVASSMIIFNDSLYVATRNGNGFNLYRSSDGASWETITGDGFGNPGYDLVTSMAVYDDGSGSKLYMGTRSTMGCGVLEYDGKGPSATIVGRDGLGDTGNDIAQSLGVYKSKLYVGTHNNKGCQVRRFDVDQRWSPVSRPGFGNPDGNKRVFALFVYGSYLYACTGSKAGTSFVDSCWILKTIAGNKSFKWTSNNVRGFADDFNRGAVSWAKYKGQLYVGTWNTNKGCGIYINRPDTFM